MSLTTDHLPELAPADLRLTVRELRAGVSFGELKPGLVRLPVSLVFGVFGWEYEGNFERFTLMRLVPLDEWRRWYGDTPAETFDARCNRGSAVDSAHPHGLIVQTQDGVDWVIDETLALRVRASNPSGNPMYVTKKTPPTATAEIASRKLSMSERSESPEPDPQKPT